MEQPNYPAVERWYTFFKFLVLAGLIAVLLSLLWNGSVFGLDLEGVSASEVVKSSGFADGIVPAGGLDGVDDADDADDDEEPKSTSVPTPTLRPTPEPPSTPTPATTSRLEDAVITWETAMIDAGFEVLTLGGEAPSGEDIRVLLDNEELDDVEIKDDDEWVVTTSVPSSGTHTIIVELLDDGDVVKRFQRELEVPERP